MLQMSRTKLSPSPTLQRAPLNVLCSPVLRKLRKSQGGSRCDMTPQTRPEPTSDPPDRRRPQPRSRAGPKRALCRDRAAAGLGGDTAAGQRGTAVGEYHLERSAPFPAGRLVAVASRPQGQGRILHLAPCFLPAPRACAHPHTPSGLLQLGRGTTCREGSPSGTRGFFKILNNSDSNNDNDNSSGNNILPAEV